MTKEQNMKSYRYIDDVEEAMKLGLAAPNARKVHLHTLSGRPLIGVTTAKGIIGNKSALYQWYADMAAVAGLALPVQDIKAEYEATQAIPNKKEKQKAKAALDKKYPDYAKARRAATASRDESADTGTERHDTLEQYIRLCIEKGGEPQGVAASDYPQEVLSFINWAIGNVKQFVFTEAHCYSEKLWVGGIADLGLIMKDGKRLVGDHKNSKEAYPDQYLQTALYDLLLTENGILDANGNKIGDWGGADGYVVFPFRSDPFTPEFKWNVDDWRLGATNTVQLYKLLEL